MLCACGTVLLKPYVMQIKLLHFGKKSWISSHGTAQHLQLRYDSQHVWRSTVQWCHHPINSTKMWYLLDLQSKMDNSAYVRTHWAKNELRHWTQFFDKEVDLRLTFQETIHQKFCIAVGRSASILALAVFWKASHLNPFSKLPTWLSNRSPITANGDE